MKINDAVVASTHAQFLNKLLGIKLKGWMQCRYNLHNGYKIWMIRLDGKKSKEGWKNEISADGNTVKELYVGNPQDKLETHKLLPQEKRFIFEIRENTYGERKYIFRGEFTRSDISDSDCRIWNKTSDEYDF